MLSTSTTSLKTKMSRFSALFRALLPGRSSKTRNPGGQMSFLALPAEIRIIIYHFIADDAFLLDVPQANYLGLLYSCKQIRAEVAYESLRPSPTAKLRLQQAGLTDTIVLPPQNPTAELCSLSNLQISLPSKVFSNPFSRYGSILSLLPALKLHLGCLTILHLPAQPSDVPTYEELAPYVTYIGCLLAPGLCVGDHHRDPRDCLRHFAAHWAQDLEAIQSIACNVRMIKLHVREKAAEAATNHGFRLMGRTKSPLRGVNRLKKHGWEMREEVVGEGGVVRGTEFVWKRMEPRARGGYKRVDGRVLKGLAKHKSRR